MKKLKSVERRELALILIKEGYARESINRVYAQPHYAKNIMRYMNGIGFAMPINGGLRINWSKEARQILIDEDDSRLIRAWNDSVKDTRPDLIIEEQRTL